MNQSNLEKLSPNRPDNFGIPNEVRAFVDKYKNYLCHLDNGNNLCLYHVETRDRITPQILRSLFYKECPLEEFEEYESYINRKLFYIVGTTFDPSQDSRKRFINTGVGVSRYNTYKSYKSSPTSATPDLFIEYLERLFPDDQQRHFVTQFFAHMLQHPAERPTYCLMLIGEQGSGKSVLFNDILRPLVSHQYQTVTKPSELYGEFSTALDSTLLVLMDDLVVGRKRDFITRIKTIIDAKKFQITRKYEQPYEQKVFARMVWVMNPSRSQQVTILPEDTRRMYLPDTITHKFSPAETQEFITKVFGNISNNPEFFDSIYNYLCSYDLTGFNPNHCPVTPALDALVNSNKDSLEQDFELFSEEVMVTTDDELKDVFKHYKISEVRSLMPALYTKRRAALSPFDDDADSRLNYWIKKGMSNTRAREWLSKNQTLFRL